MHWRRLGWRSCALRIGAWLGKLGHWSWTISSGSIFGAITTFLCIFTKVTDTMALDYTLGKKWVGIAYSTRGKIHVC